MARELAMRVIEEYEWGKAIHQVISLKTPPFHVFLGKIFPRQTDKNTPFPEKMGIHMQLPCTFKWGGGGGGDWVWKLLENLVLLPSNLIVDKLLK